MILSILAFSISQTLPYQDPQLPAAERAKDLVARMTTDEKIAQCMMDAPAIPRLGVPKYFYWSEALHGIARNGVATVFPQAIGLAATWDPELMQTVATKISTEARAKYAGAIAKNQRDIYKGLTLWSPNVNIFRDPRWGRGQETYGEDPFLTSRMGVAFVKGIQGDDPNYLRAVATPKHFAVHSGPEPLRHGFDAKVTETELRETYLPAFEACIREGKAGSCMSAYSGFNGIPATGNPWLLTTLLRDEWGFNGAVVSDVDSVADILYGHHTVKDLAEASAMAIKAGNDECSGSSYKALKPALERGLISEADIDRAATRLFTLRFRLGMFDTAEKCAYNAIPQSEIDTTGHEQLALKAARESLVLLKNDGILPLQTQKYKHVAVIGPVAKSQSVLVGNYNGDPARPVTILDGIKRKFESAGASVEYVEGCQLAKPTKGQIKPTDYTKTDDLVRKSDLVILTLGITPDLEGEEMPVQNEGFAGGDRTSLQLPAPQRELLEHLAALGKPVVVVLTAGSAVSIDPKLANGILLQWYSGEQGGTAVADTLLGQTNPSGRLPVTFYQSEKDLPPFEDYHLAGRTYRYFKGKPLFPFGFGLSYSKFQYGKAKVAPSGDGYSVTVPVSNRSRIDGDEVVEVYARYNHPSTIDPVRRLVGFKHINIAAGERKNVQVDVTNWALRSWNETTHRYEVRPGGYQLEVGPYSGKVLTSIKLTVQ